MSNNVCLDEAVECIKSILDNNRCGICDSSGGRRLRYPCGHSSCGKCEAQAGHCLLCLTPPGDTFTTSPLDNPATQRADNASELMKTFQEVYKVDVYRRHRISEQLKLEKEVFPECIQAPVKYHNRKKSYTPKNKENKWLSFFPGENVSPIKVSKMENSRKYVRQWLNSNSKKQSPIQKRQPFADLDTNQPRIRKRADIIMDQVPKTPKNVTKRKKQSPFKSALSIVEKQSVLDQYLIPTDKESKSIQHQITECHAEKLGIVKNKTDKDESGIGMDDDIIIIDDSQSHVIDKDKLAWMAVLQANENDPYVSSQTLVRPSESTQVIDCGQKLKPIQDGEYNKVPFYKRSYLFKACNLCNDNKCKKVNLNQSAEPSKDVSITIENSSFLATIKMSTVPYEHVFEKHSVPVQTDISVFDDSGCDVKEEQHASYLSVVKENLPSKNEVGMESQDLFTEEAKSLLENKPNKNVKGMTQVPIVPTPLIVGDSDDNDDEHNQLSIIQVTAEVHHSNEQLDLGVLTELDPSESQQRVKRSKRGHTPTSTDSSDKENFDPNRAKRVKHDKKIMKKRKRYHDVFELNYIGKMNE